jgi:chromosomal replication initiator protein
MEIRQILKQKFSEENLVQWFDPLDISFNTSGLKVVFPHTFFMNMVISSYKDHLEHAVSKCFKEKIYIEYNVGNNGDIGTSLKTNIQPETNPKNSDIRFDFDSFLVNHKNYFPLASAKEVATRRETVYNPFVLYGQSGSGKTHLCKAILNTLEQDSDPKNIFWGSFEHLRKKISFMAEFQKILDSDILIIDDFQEIESFQDCQHDFLSLFNAFHESGKQIVLATSRRIQEMDFLEPGLKSRLGWGLIVTLKRPDLDIRLQFITTTCQKRHIELSSEQMLTLAQHFSDFRNLQGCLLKILAFQNLISPQMAQEDFVNILKGLDAQGTTELTHEMILAVVADHLSVPSSCILSATRRQDVVFARQTAMYLCRKLLHYSFPQIGSIFGGKDHSTVIYACRKIESLKNKKQEIKHQLDVLNKKCRETTQAREFH